MKKVIAVDPRHTHSARMSKLFEDIGIPAEVACRRIDDSFWKALPEGCVLVMYEINDQTEKIRLIELAKGRVSALLFVRIDTPCSDFLVEAALPRPAVSQTREYRLCKGVFNGILGQLISN